MLTDLTTVTMKEINRTETYLNDKKNYLTLLTIFNLITELDKRKNLQIDFPDGNPE